jgi:hypothetical protein
MRSLSAWELLGVWERGFAQPLITRALELLSAVHPERTLDDLLNLSIGCRDGELLAIREQLFGPRMSAVAICPRCTGQLDLTLNVPEMRSACPAEMQVGAALSVDGFDVQFRYPNSADTIAVLNGSDVDETRERLIDLCLLSVHRESQPVPSDELPASVLDAVSECMSKGDPLADIHLSVSCPMCQHRWLAAIDIVSFLWREIESLAARLLREVHTLASAYGWAERDILALSPVRRQFYLTTLGA